MYLVLLENLGYIITEGVTEASVDEKGTQRDAKIHMKSFVVTLSSSIFSLRTKVSSTSPGAFFHIFSLLHVQNGNLTPPGIDFNVYNES